MNLELYKKMHLVMTETEALVKDMSVANQYKAISEATVLNSIKPLLKKYKLVLIPIETEVTQEGKLTVLKVSWKLIDTESGEFEVLSSVGNGADTQDKGSGKAFTYAYKAVIQKTFMLFSGEDTDNTHSDEITKAIEREKVDEKKLSKLVDLYEAMDDQFKASVLKGYRIKSIENLPTSKWDDAIAAMEKKLA